MTETATTPMTVPGGSEGGDEVEVDAAAVAAALGVPTSFLMAEIRHGNVHGIVERGSGEDEGRHRLTFRYRGRKLVMIRERDGRLAPEPAPTAEAEARDPAG